MKTAQVIDEEHLNLIKYLIGIRSFEDYETIKKLIDDGIEWACNYFHIKKGYFSYEKNEYIQNPDFELLLYWISDKTGYQWDGKRYVITKYQQAKIRFG